MTVLTKKKKKKRERKKKEEKKQQQKIHNRIWIARPLQDFFGICYNIILIWFEFANFHYSVS